MSDQLLVVIQVCLLALVYLVFLRVVRAVWVELRAGEAPPVGPRRAPTRSGAGRRGRRVSGPPPVPTPAAAQSVASLVVVAPGRLAGHTFPLQPETTIGRAPGCGVVIDDSHVSKIHARVYHDGTRWIVEDLGSTNGTLLDGAPLTAPAPIGSGSRIRVGDVELELA